VSIAERYFPGGAKHVGIVMLDGAIDMYANLLRYVSYDLRRHGIRVTLMGCASGLKACTSLRSHFQGKRLESREIADICGRCQAAQRDLETEDRRHLKPGLAREDEQFLQQIEAELRRSDTLLSVFDWKAGADSICKTAFFDFSVGNKVNVSSRLNAEQKAGFLEIVSDLLLLRAYFEQLAKTANLDAVLYVNGNYSQNQLACQVFERYAIPCMSVEPQLTSSSARNALILIPERLKLNPTALATVDDRRPLADGDIERALEHFFARVVGNEFNAYTTLAGTHRSLAAAAELRHFFARYCDVRTLFLSSEDELHAHEVVFDDRDSGVRKHSQYEVLQRFLAEAGRNPSLGFIIRLHPRMAINKRNHFVAPEHAKYVDLLDHNLPSNVLALHGDCPISSYFLVSRSSLVIVSWSTIGLEALLLGKPTIALFPEKLMYPVADFNGQPSELDLIFERVFRENPDIEVRSLRLLNWIVYAYEQQFSPIPVPRATNRRLLSRAYGWLFNRTKRSGSLGLWYRVDELAMRVHRRMVGRNASDSMKGLSLDRYRARTAGLFDRYGKILGI
jgi:hypothetical protein